MVVVKRVERCKSKAMMIKGRTAGDDAGWSPNTRSQLWNAAL